MIVVIWLIDGSLPTQIVWFVVVAADDKLISSSGETIIVPVNERETSYVAGMFYNLKDAQAYLKKMQKNGFRSASIAAFKDGEITEF